MKVILLKDVPNVGKKDALVNVADGYARNYLFRNRLAVEVTSKSMEILDQQKDDRLQAEENKRLQALELAEKLKKIILEFPVKTGEGGKVFGSVSTKAIAEKLNREYGINIDKRKFIENHTVTSLGLNTLDVELYKNVIGKLTVRLKAQD